MPPNYPTCSKMAQHDPKWPNNYPTLPNIANNKKIEEEIIFESGSRIRDVEIGPDGLIYLALENPGRIVKLSPVEE